VLLATGWTAEAVAEVLLVDPNTVRAHFKRYGKRGLECLRRVGDGGSVGLRKAKHLVELDAHLQANLYLSAKAVAYWVKETLWGILHAEWHDRGVTQQKQTFCRTAVMPGMSFTLYIFGCVRCSCQ